MKKLEDVFVSAAARENARWSEICLDGSERRMLSKVKRTESGSAVVLAQPSKELTDKAAKALDALPKPVEVEIFALDGSVTPGWAFFDCSAGPVRKLRNLLQQNFHWKVSPERLQVEGAGASPWRLERASPRREAQHEHGDQTFEQAVSEETGLTIRGRQKRLRATGWWVNVTDAVPCSQCDSDMTIFSCIQRLRSGSFRDLNAAVCAECEQVWFPDQLTSPAGRAVEALAAWSLAVDDLPAGAPKKYSCYVIDLYDESGSTLGHDREWKYVGYTSDIEKRLEVHENGDPRASRWTKRFFDSIDQERTEEFRDRFRSEAEAMAYEMYVAADLEGPGFGVKQN